MSEIETETEGLEDVELTEVEELPAPAPGTAADKVLATLRELSVPKPGAEDLQMMLSTLAMGVERAAGESIRENQESGELDRFVLAIARFIAVHRSDSATMAVVVELPRRELPAGTRLHLLDRAIKAATDAKAPW